MCRQVFLFDGNIYLYYSNKKFFIGGEKMSIAQIISDVGR